MFKTVLLPEDEYYLRHTIIKEQARAMDAALQRDDYASAGDCWDLLKRLRVLDSESWPYPIDWSIFRESKLLTCFVFSQ